MIVLKCSFVCWLAISTFAGVASGNSAATTETFTSTPTAQPQTSANQADVTTITGADQSTVKPSGLTSAMTTGPTTETVASDQGTSTPGANGISTATNNSTGTDNTAITMTQTSHTTPSSTVTQSLSASIPVLPTNQTESPDTTYTTVQPTSHSSSHPGTTGTSAAPDNSTGTDTLTTNVTQTSPTTPSRTVTQSVSASTPVLPTNSTEDPGTTYTTVHSTAPSSSTPGTNWTPSSPDSTIRTDSTPPNGTQTSHTSSPSTVTHPMNDSTPVRPTNQTASTDGNQTTVQSTPPSTSPPDYCSSNPCPFSSTCVGLFKNYTCQCVPGYYYTLRGCVEGKVFPGVLHLTKMTYKTDMSNISSKLFNETATTITEVLREILEKQEGYVESVVQKLESGSVVATVQNIYDISSNVNEKTVNSAILNKIQSCNVICGVFDGAEYQAKSLCDLNVCDPISTDCHSTDGTANCKCKPGYRELIYTNKSCGVCPSGYKASGTNCVKCPFGYSGFNCDESYLLAVVVISCVLGGLLVIVTLAFCCFCCRSSKDSSYRSPYPAEDSLTWPKQEVPRIPRASTNWDHPQMEMSENGSTHVLVNKPQQGNGVDESYDLDIDDMKTFKGKNQSRYSYLCHGQENPYFVADDDKKASK
ncbi:mucin-13 isoform X1 [Amia ocellicauda]|uniref:mucin-13 isoform X1 n=1 Tax=Amia ocellicauda TaxID=2972642 RepID=UPI003464A271